MSSDLSPSPGAVVLERFVLEQPLASGAMGSVWRGTDRVDGCPVAVKLAVGAGRERARREAEALRRVVHPGVVRHVASGESPPFEVLVMELVDGVPLSERLREGPLEVSLALSLVAQVADALAHAHAQGVVHRDVKASNLLLEEGSQRVVLLDFGLGLVEGAPRVSASDVVLGSVHTMPPEQLAGETSDGRADVYSLAALLFRMVTGSYPFHASSAVQVLAMHAHARVPLLHERLHRGLHVPRGLEGIVDRALSKAPGDRPTAEELAEALHGLAAQPREAWVTLGPEGALEDGPTPHDPTAVPRWALGVGGAGLVVALALALWWGL